MYIYQQRLRTILLALISLSFPIQGYDDQSKAFLTIDTCQIAQAQLKVTREMRQNQLYRYAFLGATTLVAGGCLYTFAIGEGSHSGMLDTSGSLWTAIPEQEKSKIIQQCTIALNNNTEALGQSTSWKSLIKQQGVYVVLSLIISGTLSPIGKYLKRIDNWVDTSLNTLFGSKNLSWFLQTHTHFDKMMEIVCKDAAHSSQEVLIVSWNILMQELIKVLGFIKYRSLVLENSFPMASQRMNQYIAAIQTHVVNVVERLSHHESNHVELATQFKDYIHATLQEFSTIESLHA